jgi:hypothetical protein
MPGIYPVKDALDVGDQISSTYEGRYLTFLESQLFHPYHADTFVDKGEPVVVQTTTGYIVGVALASALAATDLITIDTEGIWSQTVYADTDDVWATSQTGAVTPGDALFINRVTTGAITAGIGACGISKRRDHATQVPFGMALGSIDNGLEGTIAVKLHNQGSFDLISAMVNRAVVSGEMGWSFFGRITDGQSEGLNGYVDGTILGTPTGATYGFGSWIAIDNAAIMGTNVATPHDVGIYSGAVQATANLYFAGQAQAQLGGDPGQLHAWRFNTTHTIDAIFLAANAGSVGWEVGADTATYVGSIPLATVAGAVRWVKLYDGSS